MHAYVYVYMYTYTNCLCTSICMDRYTYIYIYIHIHTNMHIYTHKYAYIYLHTHIRICIHIHTHIHTHTHTYTLTEIGWVSWTSDGSMFEHVNRSRKLRRKYLSQTAWYHSSWISVTYATQYCWSDVWVVYMYAQHMYLYICIHVYMLMHLLYRILHSSGIRTRVPFAGCDNMPTQTPFMYIYVYIYVHTRTSPYHNIT
jgi:hypothetical protein